MLLLLAFIVVDVAAAAADDAAVNVANSKGINFYVGTDRRTDGHGI